MNEKLTKVELLEELDETFQEVFEQLTNDEKRWGDEWKERGLVHNGQNQETRFISKMNEYF